LKPGRNDSSELCQLINIEAFKDGLPN
jgi:hypothetical protein